MKHRTYNRILENNEIRAVLKLYVKISKNHNEVNHSSVLRILYTKKSVQKLFKDKYYLVKLRKFKSDVELNHYIEKYVTKIIVKYNKGNRSYGMIDIEMDYINNNIVFRTSKEYEGRGTIRYSNEIRDGIIEMYDEFHELYESVNAISTRLIAPSINKKYNIDITPSYCTSLINRKYGYKSLYTCFIEYMVSQNRTIFYAHEFDHVFKNVLTYKNMKRETIPKYLKILNDETNYKIVYFKDELDTDVEFYKNLDLYDKETIINKIISIKNSCIPYIKDCKNCDIVLMILSNYCLYNNITFNAHDHRMHMVRIRYYYKNII